ncbi:hypothetical protein ESCO_002223 [Escovopsis weberi]|uniref:Uncharacterized protein n=1 Tax=Escovopsis weberi TaxID=150374 RepID=A0A0M8MYY1_ESCWE|nr:hypothetical protein ESCO_002223 [Escovopsis weberi]
MRRRSTTTSTTPDTKREGTEHRETRQGVMEVADSTTPPGPSAPAGGPLQVTSPDRVNRRDSCASTLRSQSRESTVHDKISQYNNMSVSMQSRALERKTADAALERARIGREEAEAETRHLKEETRALRKAIKEGKERERKVGERLEAVMEIRRFRKETFKAQSSILKLQEELKTSREAAKTLRENLQREKEKTNDREKEAITSRDQLASLQEQLNKTLDLIKVVEQERDAYKAAAKSEEIARIATEGRIPLPASDDNDDELASPPKKKARRGSIIRRVQDPRMSLTSMEIVSSAAGELEIEELSEQVRWERQRADRAQEMVEFMQAECLMHCCPCSKSKRRTSLLASREQPSRESPRPSITTALAEEPAEEDASEQMYELGTSDKPGRGRVLDPIFFPKEGFFRTVSEQDAIALEARQEADPERTSLLSLINAPRGDAFADALPVTYSIPTLPDSEPAHPRSVKEEKKQHRQLEEDEEKKGTITNITTTTKVPVRKSGSSAGSFFGQGTTRTASTGSNASFDHKDPAMIPTVTREQALAMIRERRGRARSATQLAPGPRLKGKSKERRDMSAPTEQAAKRQRRS